MSGQITEQIEQYREGLIDFPSLLAALAYRKYPDPARYRNRPQNPFEVEVSDPPVYDEGTWDEVVRARNLGLLTQDEYLALAEAAWERAHQEAPSPVPAATGPARAQHDGRTAPARSLLSRARLQQQVAEAAGLNKAQAGRAVDAVLNSIESALKKGEEVRLTGFGSFRVTHTKARTGRSPRTGKATSIAQGKRPSFSPGSRLKQAVTGQKAG
jgi:DNA-binding protein HU-beta